MKGQIPNEFWDRLIGWEEFEHFVQKLYEDDPNLTTQHNVTLTGKSGAKRQIDVLVTQKTKMTTMITIVECKRWKQKVNRGIIDIVSSAIEDLNANKGVVFTTSGYEEGAIEYAKYKNIDIFLVRDLYEEEWGRPGRYIQFWMQFIGSKIESMQMPNALFFPFHPGVLPNLQLELCANKEDERYCLYDSAGEKGLYLGTILMDVQERTHSAIGDGVALLSEEEAERNVLYKSSVTVDMSNYKYNRIHFPEGIVQIHTIQFELLTHVSQSEFHFDRGKNLDFAFMVENYIVSQKHRVIKRKDEDMLCVSDNLEEVRKEKVDEKDILQNGSVMKAYLKANVTFDITGKEVVKETKEIRVKLETMQKE